MFIWAHRGASGEFPENTLLAFEQAIIQGADGIELDVFQVENELYIWHDRYIKDANGNEVVISERSKSWVDSIRLLENQTIPTLSQSLTAIAGRCEVNVEVKQLADTQLLVSALANAVAQQGFGTEQLLVSSFDHYFLEVWQQKALPYKIGVLSASTLNHMQLDSSLFSVNLAIDCLRKADVDKAHEQGLKVYVYTVDRVQDIELCKEYGVDGIFTNFPARTRNLIQQPVGRTLSAGM